MNRKSKTILCIVIALLCLLMACDKKTPKITGKRYEFSVVQKNDVPHKLLEQIDIQKVNAFQISYLDEKYLYLAVGYGEQETGGFSIEVERLQEEGETLYLETNLIGPKEDTVVKKKPSYPYIVIKTEAIQKDISFL